MTKQNISNTLMHTYQAIIFDCSRAHVFTLEMIQELAKPKQSIENQESAPYKTNSDLSIISMVTKEIKHEIQNNSSQHTKTLF